MNMMIWKWRGNHWSFFPSQEDPVFFSTVSTLGIPVTVVYARNPQKSSMYFGARWQTTTRKVNSSPIIIKNHQQSNSDSNRTEILNFMAKSLCSLVNSPCLRREVGVLQQGSSPAGRRAASMASEDFFKRLEVTLLLLFILYIYTLYIYTNICIYNNKLNFMYNQTKRENIQTYNIM